MMVTWRKSSYSTNGDECVEVGWRTSSHSTNGGECVEVLPGSEVLIRDTKDREGGILTASATTWSELLSRLR
jgi:hypothetical protein